VVVATLSAATAHLISVLIRPLVLVARMRVHVRMDPESAYHGFLGHERRYVLYLPTPESKAPRPLLRRIHGAAPGPAAWDVRAAWNTPDDEQPRRRQLEVPLKAASETPRSGTLCAKEHFSGQELLLSAHCSAEGSLEWPPPTHVPEWAAEGHQRQAHPEAASGMVRPG
jgi:hypothetical protein